MTKKFILLFGFAWCIQVSSAQLGFNAQYHQNHFDSWKEVLVDEGLRNTEIFRTGYKFSLDYGFGLRYYRVEFYPEFSYGTSRFGDPDLIDASTNAVLKQIGFHFRTQVYPLDLLSKKGMQCPSFHRGGDVFTKGWFLSFQPELVYSSKSIEVQQFSTDPLSSDESKLVFGFGIGTGFDIGINDYLSISPGLMYAFVLGERWPGFSSLFDQDAFNDPTSASYLSLGLRIGIWF